jgi:hypothetical protein
VLPLNASIPARLYFWNHKIGLWENFSRSTVFADKTLFHLPKIRASGTVLSIKIKEKKYTRSPRALSWTVVFVG